MCGKSTKKKSLEVGQRDGPVFEVSYDKKKNSKKKHINHKRIIKITKKRFERAKLLSGILIALAQKPERVNTTVAKRRYFRNHSR